MGIAKTKNGNRHSNRAPTPFPGHGSHFLVIVLPENLKREKGALVLSV